MICGTAFAIERDERRRATHLFRNVETLIPEQLTGPAHAVSNGVHLGYHLPDLGPILLVDSEEHILLKVKGSQSVA